MFRDYFKLGIWCSTYNSLYAGAKGGVLLGWYKRLEITVGIAQGLDYLHSFAVCIPLKLIAITNRIPNQQNFQVSISSKNGSW